ncbi:hypothetical protein ACSDQ9_04015 [Aestuariimicrobium soli]|uniref:hypothetical protein n=1 Tax=Aestuariimicrobium soli TaxID=2035834 RepID=UPI003EBFB947
MTTPSQQPGLQRLGDPRVFGTLIGAIAASAFVFANRGTLPAPWPLICLLVWLVAILGYLASNLLVRRYWLPLTPPTPRAGLVYLASVVAMVAVFVIGRLLLPDRLAHLQVSIVTMAVGAHFLPFAKAFAQPFFTRLGATMLVQGAVGFVLGFFWHDGPAALAVFTGLTILVMQTSWALATRVREPAHP